MMRRGIWLVTVLAVFILSIPAQAIPSHKNFDEAPQDLYAIIAFLSDTLTLCEDSLSSSLNARCSITINQTVTMTYAEEQLNASLQSAALLKNSISYSTAILGKLKNKAQSYYYLKDLLIPLKELGSNISSLVYYHQQIIENITTIINFLSYGINESAAVHALGTIKAMIYKGKTNLTIIQQRVDQISHNFSTSSLQALIPLVSDLFNIYDSYTNSLVELYTDVQPHLLLFTEKPHAYLGETIHVFGYFIAQRMFVTNHTVTVQWDNDYNTTLIRSNGRYDWNLSIPITMPLGIHRVTASTWYTSTMHFSPTLTITIEKIPTNITLFITTTHYYTGEPIRFSGRLIDYYTRGIQGTITLSIGTLHHDYITEENGSFSFLFQDPLAFGVYPTFISFNSSVLYDSSRSSPLNIFIDTPTNLTLSLVKSTVTIGETLTVQGQLTSSINNSPLQQKIINISVNDRHVGSGVTDTNGWYRVAITTNTFHEGTYTVTATFTSSETEWRNSTSIERALTLTPGLFFINTLLIIGGTLIIAAVLYGTRKKLISLRKKKSSRPLSSIPSQKPSIFERPKTISVSEESFLQPISGAHHDEFRDVIISKYRSFLSHLFTSGVIIPGSFTHLEIKKILIHHGFSKLSTDEITDLFEQAMYSPYPVGKKEVTTFNIHLHTLLTSLGGNL